MARHDVSGHALLSPAASALEAGDAAAFAAQNDLAERTLGIEGTDFTPEERATTALLAVVVQLNYQVEMDVDAYVLSSESRGARSKSFAGTGAPARHPLALSLIRGLTSGDWNTVTAVR